MPADVLVRRERKRLDHLQQLRPALHERVHHAAGGSGSVGSCGPGLMSRMETCSDDPPAPTAITGASSGRREHVASDGPHIRTAGDERGCAGRRSGNGIALVEDRDVRPRRCAPGGAAGGQESVPEHAAAAEGATRHCLLVDRPIPDHPPWRAPSGGRSGRRRGDVAGGIRRGVGDVDQACEAESARVVCRGVGGQAHAAGRAAAGEDRDAPRKLFGTSGGVVV